MPQYDQPNHKFHHRSHLTDKKMKEISDWIGTLSAKDRKKLDILLKDSEYHGESFLAAQF